MEQQQKSLVQVKAKQSHVMYTVCCAMHKGALVDKNSITPVLHHDQNKVLG